jgi:hypothetical protein
LEQVVQLLKIVSAPVDNFVHAQDRFQALLARLLDVKSHDLVSNFRVGDRPRNNHLVLPRFTKK